MDAASNGDSDHSLTWEDFYGSTTDLTPTLIGILNDFLDSPQKEAEPKEETIKQHVNEVKRKMDTIVFSSPSKDPRLIAGSIKLPGLSSEEPSSIKTATASPSPIKKSPPKMSYVSRLKSFGLRKNSVSESKDELKISSDPVSPLGSESGEIISKLNDEVIAKAESNRKINIDPETPKPLTISIPKRPNLGIMGRSSYRSKHSIIPLMGATSKITQSSMDIETTTEIYDKPTNPVSNLAKINIPIRSSIRFVSPSQSSLINRVTKDWSPKPLSTFSPDSSPIKQPKTPENEPAVYDIPISSAAIYDIPNGSRKVLIEETSLPYIDQSSSIEIESKSTPVITVNIENVESSIPYVNGELKNEDNRLNLPGLNQVIRPLSMSSIASSTSTSSSGNQNKGANSAYLASIESLDDHSDMDAYGQNAKLTQINGSSLTMDSTDGGNGSSKTIESSQLTPPRPMTPPRPRYCDPSLSLLQRVCTEIVDTENVYVEDLRQVVEGYLYFWQEEETFATEQLSDLFSNVEEIYKFNKAFSEHLNECNLEAIAIAKCFVHHSSGFGIYTQYCTDYPGIMAALARLMREPDSAQPFRSRQTALGHALPLGSYLLKPVQRILKYHLLLQNLVKQHKSHDTEYALNKMTGIAHDINEMKRRHEHSVRVQEIQSLLYGWNGQDLTTFGELCAEGTFRVFGAKAMRHAFLFDKMLLLTKNKEYGMLAYKSHIMCNNLMLVESIQGQPLSFHVIPFDCPRMQVTLQARSIQHKREWTLLIKRNILENYNAVIPSHARQLVMELGQNKTDDDILAEKSSTLMSHSSMRKQLGAPEYLEKRKLERDRRKSFESGLRYRLKRSATRKDHTYNTAIENDESEKELNLKDSHSHYVCSDCYHVDRSNLSICEDCDDQFICANCVEDSKDVCKKCKNENENDRENEKRFNLKNKHKCNIEKSQYVCCKCAKPGLPCEKLTDNILLRVDSPREFSNLMTSKDLCESCLSTSKSSLNKYSSEKNIYDRINDDNKTLDIKRTCLKCHEIRENIINDDESLAFISQKDINCTMCGRQNFICPSCKVVKVSDNHKNDESLHCVNCNCRSPRIKKCEETKSPVIEIKMYNAKTVPKKISKIKKNRAKTLRHITVDSTAKFYTDINDLTSDEVLHISESTDSINNINDCNQKSEIPADMDEDMYKSLIQKTDSFKKSELEKDKLASQVLKEQDEPSKENNMDDEVFVSCDDAAEKPLEQIISQLVMQKREFQKRLKKHQLKNANNRRHQRLIKSHSNPEKVFIQSKDNQFKTKVKFGRQLSAIEAYSIDMADGVEEDEEKGTEEPIYETLLPNKIEDDKKNEQLNENTESDYVYLCFEGRKNIDAYKLPVDFDTGEYAIPNCTPKNIYDDVEIRNSLDANKTDENESNENYENTSDIWKRISKDTVIENKAFKKAEIDVDDYSDTDGLQSPNLPKIWLNRQKEHFNTPREKKSGSLPRSFQVHNEQNTFLYQNNKPGNANKLYLNKDGRVMQTDRPFTIASDHSEISYDDIERFIKNNDNSDLKFPQKNQIADSSFSLDEEVEIDRWYKNRFGSEQDNSTMNTSTNNSSLEVNKLECETSQEDITQSVHPEHKVYKPTNTNMLSFKSVLNRFKSKSKTNTAEEDVPKKTSPKSGRTIMQRLKSMKSEEQSDTNVDNVNNNPSVLITDTDLIKRPELILSKSFCEDPVTNLNDVELVSKSCNNINGTKSTKVPQSTGIYLSMNKASKSTQELNKFPNYKQGSKLLGARIAQSDYADPKLLMESFSELNKVNMFINKSALRPDSVLSNSSHFTSSSDGYMTANTEISKTNANDDQEVHQIKSDESFYEKSLEEFEKLCNKEEILRDSAIYSDPEDGMSYLNVNEALIAPKPAVAVKKDSISKLKTMNVRRVSSTLTSQVTSIVSERTESRVFKFESGPKIPDINLDKNCNSNTLIKVKAAPPVPLKPMINKNQSFKQITRSTISTIPCKSNIEIKKPIIIESLNSPSNEVIFNFDESKINSNPTTPTSPTEKKIGIPRPNFHRAISTTSNINLKRMSFERCSLDSSALNRRLKHSSVSSLELPSSRTEELVISKSVQERKKEIEMIENRKSLDCIDSSSVNLSRSYSLKNGSKIQSYSNKTVMQKCNIPVRNNLSESKIVENIVNVGDVNKNESSTSDDVRNGNDRAGWVKQVVNRFQ